MTAGTPRANLEPYLVRVGVVDGLDRTWTRALKNLTREPPKAFDAHIRFPGSDRGACRPLKGNWVPGMT